MEFWQEHLYLFGFLVFSVSRLMLWFEWNFTKKIYPTKAIRWLEKELNKLKAGER